MSREVLLYAVGEEAADQLATALGGSDYRVPCGTEGAGYERLARIVGFAAAERLVRAAAGDVLYIPRNQMRLCGERNAEIARLLADGMTPAQVAQTYRYEGRVSERHVYRILSRIKRSSD